ncbi:MAG: hypothetical protein AAF564_23990 [Bacteroidota bacterium]
MYSFNSFDDAGMSDLRERKFLEFPMEFELITNNYKLPVGDLAFSFARARQAMDKSLAAFLFVDLSDVDATYTSLTARYFFSRNKYVRPYLGGAFGRSRLTATWNQKKYNPARYICAGACSSQESEDLFKGFNPELRIGVEALGGLMLEFGRSFNRGNAQYPMTGSRFSIGVRRRVSW